MEPAGQATAASSFNNLRRVFDIRLAPPGQVNDPLIRSERGSRETRSARGANHPVLADFKVVMGHPISPRRRASRRHAVGRKKRLSDRLRAEKVFQNEWGKMNAVGDEKGGQFVAGEEPLGHVIVTVYLGGNTVPEVCAKPRARFDGLVNICIGGIGMAKSDLYA